MTRNDLPIIFNREGSANRNDYELGIAFIALNASVKWVRGKPMKGDIVFESQSLSFFKNFSISYVFEPVELRTRP